MFGFTAAKAPETWEKGEEEEEDAEDDDEKEHHELAMEGVVRVL